MALVAQTDLEARIGRTLTAEEGNAFTTINAALQALVEKMIGSSVESVSETTRKYDGGMQTLKIDPCTSITSVDLVDDDGSSTYTYDTSDYTTEPVNSTVKQAIRHRAGAFVSGMNNIAVTALFSIYADTDTRNIVKNAMIEALSELIGNSENIRSESIEGYSVQYIEEKTKDALSPIKYLFPRI